MGERSLKPNNATRGPIKVIRPKELAEQGITGTVAEGIYEGTQMSKGGVSPKTGKVIKPELEYKVRGADDTLYILKRTSGLDEQLGQLAADGSDKAKIRVQYDGKVVTKSGNDFHNFTVFVVD